jgi:hypothetical protein
MLTVYSCPGGAQCKELKRYSDHALQKLALGGKLLYYFDSTVKCNTIFANTNEIRLRFTSDGPAVKNNDIPSSVMYKGFSAVYVSSPVEQKEQTGCPLQNITLTINQGSIFAVDTTQIESTSVTSGQADTQWLQHHQIGMTDTSRYGTTTFKQEYVKRCQARRGGACYLFERQESRWWIISPKTQAAQTTQTFALAFRDLILEDSLDVLTVYARVNGVVSKVNTFSGLSPVRNHEVMKCSKCNTDCKTLAGRTGSVSERAAQKTTDVACTWIITAIPTRHKYLVISASSFNLKSSNRISIESCMEGTCLSVSDKFDVFGYEGYKLTDSSFTSRTGIVKISFNPSYLEKDEGFKLDWRGMCKDPPEYFKKNEDALDDGWTDEYPELISCSWIISPEDAANVTINFAEVAMVGPRDKISVEACYESRCQNKDLLGSLQQYTTGTFTSGTGIILVTMETYERSGISAFARGFQASWTISKKIQSDSSSDEFVSNRRIGALTRQLAVLAEMHVHEAEIPEEANLQRVQNSALGVDEVGNELEALQQKPEAPMSLRRQAQESDVRQRSLRRQALQAANVRYSRS